LELGWPSRIIFQPNYRAHLITSGSNGGVGLILYRRINQPHFLDLPPDGIKSRSDQQNGYPVSGILTAILADFLAAIGAAFCMYGVNKSRDIGGWAVWIILLGWAVIWWAESIAAPLLGLS
jgi:hypothetical protein